MAGKKGQGAERSRRERALGQAVRKVEEKEAKQDAKAGKTGKPIGSVGRAIRDGWRGAKG